MTCCGLRNCWACGDISGVRNDMFKYIRVNCEDLCKTLTTYGVKYPEEALTDVLCWFFEARVQHRTNSRGVVRANNALLSAFKENGLITFEVVMELILEGIIEGYNIDSQIKHLYDALKSMEIKNPEKEIKEYLQAFRDAVNSWGDDDGDDDDDYECDDDDDYEIIIRKRR